MNRLQKGFNNGLALLLLLVIGVGIVWFFSSWPEPEQEVVQQPQATPISTVQQQPTETPTPDLQVSTTPTLHPLTPLDDDSPEPTWTPVIIIPEPTLPLPTPEPTRTATPVNPNESELVVFDVPVGELAISPNDQTLALVSLVEISEGTFVNQIWTIDIAPKKVNKLEIEGFDPVWSLNGQQILFRVWQGDEFEIKVVDKSGQNEKSLKRLNKGDFLDYYWVAPQAIEIVSMDGVEQIDVSGKTINHRNLDLPPGLRNQAVKRVDRGQNGEVVVINNQAKNLLIIREDGQNVEIKDGAGRSIERFGLAKHSDRLAYVVNEGPNNELWINNLSGSVPKNLRRLDFHSVQHILWMPDNQTILIGWAEAGTNSQTFLFWLDSETGEEVPVGVHGIAQDLILNHTANKLFYTLSIKDTLDGSEQTTIYQLQIGQSTKFVNSDSIMA